ncbi:MAG TPA: response regulator transcription factor [bacterium]|nr:response regulator transcription factor [bacterium]
MTPIRVVLVDDNAGFRGRMARLLGLESGLEVAGEAADGREAITKARELRPDVILMDFRMTTMDGFTAARAILKDVPGVKIFMLTAYPGALDRAKVSSNGLQGLLIKDQPIGEIVEAIRKSVGTVPVPDPAPGGAEAPP